MSEHSRRLPCAQARLPPPPATLMFKPVEEMTEIQEVLKSHRFHQPSALWTWLLVYTCVCVYVRV